MDEDLNFSVTEPSRLIPIAIKRHSDGMVFNLGDTIVFNGKNDKMEDVKSEAIITLFSFDEYGEMYLHTNKSGEHRIRIIFLHDADNKTADNFSHANKIASVNGFSVIKK